MDLVLAHQHPDDRAEVRAVFERALRTGRPFAVWHRLHDALGGTHHVLTTGAGDVAEDGSLRSVTGYVVDVTEDLRRTTAHEVEEAMEQMAHSRPLIEQAKGVLMLRFSLDPDTAFALLRRCSQRTNVKVRDLAREVVEAVEAGSLGPGSPELWATLVAELREQQGPAAGEGREPGGDGPVG